ncbi:MAG TPA: DUF58 domain-containing protein [Candidatus Latescibacteria bacterium]|nr:DUF58 domain-containing protein [Candidatus Handelsmanbacteria bacterium]HIL07384.1 DUF58 domain-containing protein [Candidatus Latescibacterota bacterium]
MIPKEILDKVRLIEIHTRNMVNNLFAGEYHSVFKGRGMEFAEAREYQPGDDVRHIDWNVTARVGDPFIKVFDEEREMTVMLLVDASASGAFGSQQQMKGEVGVEVSALLAFSAIQNNDRVGLLIFTDEVEVFVPPKKGRKHVLRVIRELLYFQPQGRRTSIAGALEYLGRVLHRRSVVFVVSDFQDKEYETALRHLSRRHDLIAVSLSDPREWQLPDVGFINLQDAETGEQVLVDSGDRGVRKFYAAEQKVAAARRGVLFRKTGVDEIAIDATKPYVDPLIHFFRARMKRR